MKKFALITAVALAASFATSPAIAATPKPGASCSKVSTTQTYGGKKYTCIAVGKKLVWNNGVKLVSQPTPSSSAPAISLDNLDPTWTLKVALANVQQKLASTPTTSLAPEMIYSPNTSSDEKALEQKLLVPAMRLFQEYFAPTKYQVVMFTNLDGTWADNALQTYGGGFPSKLSDEIARWSTNSNFCNFAFATQTSSRTPIYYECTDTRQMRNWSNYQNPPHEYFHLVQQHLAPVQMSEWLVEGSASFFGEAIGFANFSNPVQSKKDMNVNTSHDFDPDNKGFDPNRFVNWAKTANAEEVTRVFKMIEVNQLSNGDGNRLAYYSLGSIATEALVASFGVDGFMKIWPALASGASFESAFKTTFGITPDSFYAKLAPYLNKRG
jgi:hypothetical protein